MLGIKGSKFLLLLAFNPGCALILLAHALCVFRLQTLWPAQIHSTLFNNLEHNFVVRCWTRWANEFNTFDHTWEHRKSWINITEHHCTGWHTWEQKKSRQNCETSLSWKAKLVFKIQQRWSVLNRTLNPPVNRFVVFFTVGSFKKRLHALQCQSSRVVFRWCLLSIESGKPKTHKKSSKLSP